VNIAVVGGGVIGLGIAGELASDHEVTLLERGRFGSGASRAAAGMLGPIMEVEFHEPELLELGTKSHRLYPDFVETLEAETGIATGFRTEGTLGVAFDPDGAEELRRLLDYQQRLGLDVEAISVEKCREFEPRISSYISMAMYTASDYQIDNRRLVRALRERCRRRGVRLREEQPVRRIHVEDGAARRLITDEDSLEADLFVVCAGAWTPRLEGLSGADRLPVRPVKGQAVAVALSDPPEIRHVVRSPDVYCVPKNDGRMVIGATMEEEGFDHRVTAGGVLDLLHRAYELLPFVYERELLETWSGLRPASRDNLPILGPSAVTENLAFAAGHYRNGILLTPITVQLMARWIDENTVPEGMKPLLPNRFVEGCDGTDGHG